LSSTDARNALEAKEPDLVLARDNQVVIQRRASTQDKKRGQWMFSG
jgi:hypothetical protein